MDRRDLCNCSFINWEDENVRATDYLIFVVIIGIVATWATLGVSEFNTIEAGETIDIANLTDNYEDIENINSRVNDSLEVFQKLGDDDASWFSKVSAGIVAIPKVVIGFPILIMTGVASFTGMIVTALTGIIPPMILYGLLAIIGIIILRRFMEFFQRARA